MIGANEIERIAKERPDECFLKGTGILKLTGAIRTLERQNKELLLALRAITPDLLVAADLLSDRWKAQSKAVGRRLVEEHVQTIDHISEVFDAWENGDPCYEDPDDSAAYLGMAFRLPDETFHACCDLLNKHYPKINNAAIPPVSGALDERETLDAAIAASQSTEA